MLPASMKKEIFLSVPRNLTFGGSPLTVLVEYADRANVSEMLESNDIVVTLRYFADRPDAAASPTNGLFKKEVSGADIVYTRGERDVVTLSVNVHAHDTPARKADDVLHDYLNLLQLWIVRDLPEILQVIDRTGVTDLTWLDGTSRRAIDIIVRYSLTYRETVGTIDTVDEEVTVE